MKRKKGGRLRDREDRTLSAYANKGKPPSYEGAREPASPEALAALEQHWRKPRGTQASMQKPFTRR